MSTSTPFANGFQLSDAQHSQLETAVVVAQGLIPLLPPQAALVLTLASQLYASVQKASASGEDVTDEVLMSIFGSDLAAAAADAGVRAAMAAAPPSPSPVPAQAP